MNLLHDRVVLVSGGTQGVGAGIVRAAAGEGAPLSPSPVVGGTPVTNSQLNLPQPGRETR